jgi:hypothetical protein
MLRPNTGLRVLFGPNTVFGVTIVATGDSLFPCGRNRSMNGPGKGLALLGMTGGTIDRLKTTDGMRKGRDLGVAIDAGETLAAMNVRLPLLWVHIERTNSTIRLDLLDRGLAMAPQTLVIGCDFSMKNGPTEKKSEKKSDPPALERMSETFQNGDVLTLVHDGLFLSPIEFALSPR